MTTALYRKNGGEVIKISLTNQPFTDIDTNYFGVLTDPALPDGTDTKDEDGNDRVLGFAKIATLSPDTVRNATQPEIDLFAPAQTEDENLQDKSRGQVLFNDHPQYRKIFKAMLKEFALEFDRSRVNPKAQMSIINGNTQQLMTSKTWEVITLFNTAAGEDTVSHDSLTSVKANNHIQLDQKGRHVVSYSISLEGDNNTEFWFDVGRNGTKTDRAKTRIKLGADGSRVVNVSATCILNFPGTPPNFIQLMCRNNMNNGRNIEIKDAQLVIFRNENRAKRPASELQTDINAQFSEDD